MPGSGITGQEARPDEPDRDIAGPMRCYLPGRRHQLGQSLAHGLWRRQRNPLAWRDAQQQDQAAAEVGGPDHGPMACGRVSLRMKMSRPW